MKEKPERAGKKEGTGKKERTARMLTNPWVAGLLAVCCTALWGSAYPCVKSGYELFQIAGEDVSSDTFCRLQVFCCGDHDIYLFLGILGKSTGSKEGECSRRFRAGTCSDNTAVYLFLHRRCKYHRGEGVYHRSLKHFFYYTPGTFSDQERENRYEKRTGMPPGIFRGSAGKLYRPGPGCQL